MLVSPQILDDDSVSNNSTVPSEPRSEYPLEAILAERDVNGTKKYLVKWEGYPDERCTWETESNFQDDQTLREWALQKLRIKRKAALPYDVSALETRVENWITETKARKARRRAKRVRLGLPVASEDPEEPEHGESQDEDEDEDEDSSNDAMDYEETPLTSPKRFNGQTRHRTESSRSTVIKSDSEDEVVKPTTRSRAKVVSSSLRSRRKVDSIKYGQKTVGNAALYSSDDEPLNESSKTKTTAKTPTKNRRASVARKGTEDKSSTEEPVMRDSRTNTLTNDPTKNQATTRVHKTQSKALPRTQQGEDLHRSSFDKTRLNQKPLKSPATISESSKALVRDKKGSSNQQLGRTGRGPARIVNAPKSAASKARPLVTGAAILGNWDSQRKKRKSMQLPQGRGVTNTGNSSTFGKLSIKRKYEKAGRSEPAPNPDQLTFLNVKDGKPLPKTPTAIPSAAPKTPFQMIQENLIRAAMSTVETAEQTDTTQADTAQANTAHTYAIQTDAAQTDTAQAAVEDDDAMHLDAQVESPGTIGTEVSNSSESMNNESYSLNNWTTLGNKLPSRFAAPIEQQEDTMTGISHSLSKDLFLPALGASPKPHAAFISRAAASISDNLSSESATMLGDHQREIPSHSTSTPTKVAAAAVPTDHQHDDQNEFSGSVSMPMNDLERISRETAEKRALLFVDAPWHQKTDLPGELFRPTPSSIVPPAAELKFQHPVPSFTLDRLRGDYAVEYGVAKIGPHRQHYVDNMSDVFGTIFAAAEKIGDVRFRGLGTAAKQLFMTIKVPPRDMAVRCEQICTAEDYRSYFHSVSEISIPAHHGLVLR